MKIRKIWAIEILDSRGFPTIQAFAELENNHKVTASIPSGASVGKLEAIELRDGDKKRFMGKGVLKAINNLEKILAPNFIGKTPDVTKADEIILNLDGTSNKSNLGANATLAISLLITKAQAYVDNIEIYQLIKNIFNSKNINLPKAMFNILNGGAHADNGIAFQEFMIIPQKDSFAQNLEISCVIYHTLKKILKKDGYSIGVGDEGGFAPILKNNNNLVEYVALDLISKSIQESGYILGKDVSIGLDVAASQFYNEKTEKYILNNKTELNFQELTELYKDLIKKYSIISIEDGLAETDWAGWKYLTEKLGSSVQIVGDDIFVTNINQIKKGIEQKVANAVLIKPNQIGTVTETLNAIKLCQTSGYKTVVSHRSGETCDTFISDLVVGTNSGQFKSGAPARGERVAKYNRLLEIETSLK